MSRKRNRRDDLAVPRPKPEGGACRVAHDTSPPARQVRVLRPWSDVRRVPRAPRRMGPVTFPQIFAATGTLVGCPGARAGDRGRPPLLRWLAARTASTPSRASWPLRLHELAREAGWPGRLGSLSLGAGRALPAATHLRRCMMRAPARRRGTGPAVFFLSGTAGPPLASVHPVRA